MIKRNVNRITCIKEGGEGMSEVKRIIQPKCPYCKKEFKAKSCFDNPLSRLYGDYCSNVVTVTCPFCNEKYEVRKQVRFLTRRVKII